MRLPKIKLTYQARDRISQIIADSGLVLMASVILPGFLSSLNIPRFIAGNLIVTLLWFFSIKISNSWIK